MTSRVKFDFSILNNGGLKRGFTTGAAAAAAVKAALYKLIFNLEKKEIETSLPNEKYFVCVPIRSLELLQKNQVKVSVIKDAGDDPDVTHKARIFSTVTLISETIIRFTAGKGVGTFTEPGFQYPIGEPAINQVPRNMIQVAINEVLQEAGKSGSSDIGFEIEIGCEKGEEITKKTYNPRLGIVNGISILGTTGIVEPMSLSSYLASIELYIRVAIADSPNVIIFSPGNIGQKYALKALDIPLKRIVQMSNFVGFSLDSLDKSLEEFTFRLRTLSIIGHPGKLGKLLEHSWDTHSKRSKMAMEVVSSHLSEFTDDTLLIEECQNSKTVEGISKILKSISWSQKFWRSIENKISILIQERVKYVDQIEIVLVNYHNERLS